MARLTGTDRVVSTMTGIPVVCRTLWCIEGLTDLGDLLGAHPGHGSTRLCLRVSTAVIILAHAHLRQGRHDPDHVSRFLATTCSTRKRSIPLEGLRECEGILEADRREQEAEREQDGAGNVEQHQNGPPRVT